MAETESMPTSFMEDYEEMQREEYIEAKEAYNQDKLSKVKTMKHE